MYLYRVVASETEYDRFSEGVVYAESAQDAKDLVRELCQPGAVAADNVGVWYEIDPGATLRATRVSVRRGPVMGYGRAG